MKKIFLSSIALLAPLFLSAQIDRDKMPEPNCLRLPWVTLI